MAQSRIVVRGASEHNLKGVSVSIPRGSLTTITGVSGSGKSSLAFDTIHNEGQRRFLESLSSYARQFLGQIAKPAVEQIDGLSPTVSIDQKTVNRNPRSTVGTVTELHDHLRLLFARLGEPHCPDCGALVKPQAQDQILDALLAERMGRDLLVLAPIVRDRKGAYRKELEDLRLKGFSRVRCDGEVRRLDEKIELARYARHTIEVVIDRIRLKPEKTSRLAEALEQALGLGDGLVGVLDGDEHLMFSTRNACIDCGQSLPELEPRLFSFNSPQGACPDCGGLGLLHDVDLERVVPDPTLSLVDGCLAPLGKSRLRDLGGVSIATMPSLAKHYRFDLATPWEELEEEIRRAILFGSEGQKIHLKMEHEGKNWKVKSSRRQALQGLVPGLRAVWERSRPRHLERFFADQPCPKCDGSRLAPLPRSVLFRGKRIHELSRMSVERLRAFFQSVQLGPREEPVGRPILQELESRLEFLVAVGLGYLSLDRNAATLSGGESQRIRLATQVGARLKGILYVLDEPSIGLHARDNQRLIGTLESLRDLGNTVLVVEHDQETMERSDYIVDVGPGPGVHGGEVVHEGTYSQILKNRASLTGRYLAGKQKIPLPATRRGAGGEFLRILGARHNNLRSIDVSLPVGLFTVVTGASGSGKSSLIDDTLKRALAAHYHQALARPGDHDAIDGFEHFDKVIEIDQKPIGRTPRSNPATYTKVFDLIRELFAQLPEAKARGWDRGRFSFNVEGGRCEACRGAGVKTVSMQFLPDVEVECDVCEGRRFHADTLEVRYREKDIHEVLDMTVEEARDFFENHPKIVRILNALLSVGLGYVRLGQPATTLSGGEAQRMKLASELRRPPTGRTLYLLDEPTTGLHFVDVKTLIDALQSLVDRGNTVVVIEHNLDVVKVADWVVDLGPDGGEGGGRLVYEGPLDGLLEDRTSHTAAVLREHLGVREKKRRKRRYVSDQSVQGEIRIEGARLHNLKNVDVKIPTGSFTVVTGPSGSGKTSLAFDTIFAEGQRRFVESLSAYARQFLGRLEKAPVDRIEGLAPSIAINQRNASRNPRSTVSTTTEIHDHLRLLYARVGRPHCPECGEPMTATSPVEGAHRLLRERGGEKGHVLAPLLDRDLAGLSATRVTQVKKRLATLRGLGYVRLLVDGKEVRFDRETPALGRARSVALVVDRMKLGVKGKARLAEAVEAAFQESGGLAIWRPVEGEPAILTENRRCPRHGHEVAEMSPRLFSFNHHHGSCPTCHGLGELVRCDEERLVNRPFRSILKGAMDHPIGRFFKRKSYFRHALKSLAKHRGFDIETPWERLDEEARAAILDGTDEKIPFKIRRRRKDKARDFEANVRWPGLRGYVEKWWGETESEKFRSELSQVMSNADCPSCEGKRLCPEALSVKLGGVGIHELSRLTIAEARAWIDGLRLAREETVIAQRPLQEVRERLRFLEHVGLEYLTLDRSAATLSGGEAQRIRLATQIGSRLTGVIYVLDEPTIGLHQRDVGRLLETLDELKALGNTIVVVEHDEDSIEHADWIVDLGPGAGRHGGEVVYQGPRKQLHMCKESLTAAYLTGASAPMVRTTRRAGTGQSLGLRGVRTNNLKSIDVELPLGCFTAVTGVSGSGKSSLVVSTLVPALARSLGRKIEGRPLFDKLSNARHVSDLVVIDQAPIGRTPKSNPVTYTGCFDDIRALFATAPMARMKGYAPGRFSFNAAGGRCDLCMGRGAVKVEMNFLADVWLTCEACKGRRYNSETLTVEWRGKTIADVLEMEVDEALRFFENHRRICRPLQTLSDVGLGYLQLGQPSNTLSGGEAQRIKLARELSRRAHGKVLYVLDEPTTGLHFEDVAKLITVLDRLVDQGHSVVVIEHNLDVIQAADHVIDLGPEGGDEGGRVVVVGTPEDIMAHPESYTGLHLKKHLARAKRRRARRGKTSRGGAETKGAQHGCPA